MSKNVAVVGLGYVGLPLATQTAQKDYQVTGIDLDETKVAQINKGVSPIEDEFAKEQLEPELITATTDASVAKDADIVLICVPTPVKNDYQPDLAPLKKAIGSVAKHLKEDVLLVIESTINPGVSDEVILPLLEKEYGLKPGRDFYLSHCPERINPGDPDWTVANIPRVVGSFDQVGLDKTVEFYKSIIDAAVKPMGSLKEAEAVKIVENSFRDINIAFVNELAMSFSKLGINVMNVIDGAATKPFAFMPHYPGAGVGGHCIPVDPYYLIEYARGKGFDHEFLLLARQINSKMPEFTIELLQDALNEAGIAVKGTKVALLGISYKPNVGDDRESPSYHLQTLLKELGAKVDTFDPHMLEKSDAKSLDLATDNAEAILIATAHDEFKNLTVEKLEKSGVKVVVDGRNCLNKEDFEETGVIYKGVGV